MIEHRTYKVPYYADGEFHHQGYGFFHPIQVSGVSFNQSDFTGWGYEWLSWEEGGPGMYPVNIVVNILPIIETDYCEGA